MKNQYFSIVAFLLCIPIWTFGQDIAEPVPSISTDRPSQGTNSPITLPKGYLQLESGVSYTQFISHPSWVFEDIIGPDELNPFADKKDLKVNIYSLPEFSFRYGIADRVELKLGSTLQHTDLEESHDSFPVAPETFLKNWALGIKYQALIYNKSRGHLSFIGEGVIPDTRSGKHLIESDWGIHFDAINSYSLNDWYEFTTNIGYSYGKLSGISKEKKVSWALLNSFLLVKKLSFFAEWYGSKAINPNLFDSNKELFQALDGGFLYQLSHNIQVDLSGGFGLTEDISEYEFHMAAGLSWRTKLFR